MITVITENDERTFNADGWVIDDTPHGRALTIGAGKEIIAQYAPGGWQYVLQADSEVSAQVPASGDT